MSIGGMAPGYGPTQQGTIRVRPWSGPRDDSVCVLLPSEQQCMYTEQARNRHGRRARVGSGLSLDPLASLRAHHRSMTNVPSKPSYPQHSRHSPDAEPRRTSTRQQRLAHVALAGLIVAISVGTNAAAPFLVVALFILVVPFEKLFPRHRGQRVHAKVSAPT